MDESTRKIVDGLQHAMRTETDGHHFYALAAGKVEDDKGREVFETLAREELGHLSFLKSHHDAYQKTGKPDPAATLGSRARLDGDNPIFSDKLKDRIGDAHFEMSALSIGMQLELNAERYYREQSEQAQDPNVKDFFRELADWEAGHYRALQRQQESLKEDYWAAGGFAPF